MSAEWQAAFDARNESHHKADISLPGGSLSCLAAILIDCWGSNFSTVLCKSPEPTLIVYSARKMGRGDKSTDILYLSISTDTSKSCISWSWSLYVYSSESKHIGCEMYSKYRNQKVLLWRTFLPAIFVQQNLSLVQYLYNNKIIIKFNSNKCTQLTSGTWNTSREKKENKKSSSF